MQIVHSFGDDKVKFGDLENGETFRERNYATSEVWLKTVKFGSPSNVQAVRLSDGEFTSFHDDELVIHVHGKFVIEDSDKPSKPAEDISGRDCTAWCTANNSCKKHKCSPGACFCADEQW